MTVGEYIKSSKLSSLDCRIFLEEVCSISPSRIITDTDRVIKPQELETLNEYTEKRLSGLPVAYITGHKDFYKSTFLTDRDVLIPRPDTETLVEDAVAILSKTACTDSVKILDLCAGTGCIGISIVLELKTRFQEISLQLSDISTKAFNCFSKNADTLVSDGKIKIFKTLGDLFAPVSENDFDMIVANPPYINTDVIPTLSREVQSEPVLALDGGKDGLDLIEKIVENAPSYLKKGGWLLMEIGYDQAKRVKKLFTEKNFSDVEVLKDLGGNDRVVKGRILCTKN